MTEKYTQGILLVHDDWGVLKYQCYTLELPWKNNTRRESCIPDGRYLLHHRTNEKFGAHLSVTPVPNRDGILIHPGNYTSQILGCILPGTEFADINKDGIMDIQNSRKAMAALVKLLPTTGVDLTVHHAPSFMPF